MRISSKYVVAVRSTFESVVVLASYLGVTIFDITLHRFPPICGEVLANNLGVVYGLGGGKSRILEKVILLQYF